MRIHYTDWGWMHLHMGAGLENSEQKCFRIPRHQTKTRRRQVDWWEKHDFSSSNRSWNGVVSSQKSSNSMRWQRIKSSHSRTYPKRLSRNRFCTSKGYARKAQIRKSESRASGLPSAHSQLRVSSKEHFGMLLSVFHVSQSSWNKHNILKLLDPKGRKLDFTFYFLLLPLGFINLPYRESPPKHMCKAYNKWSKTKCQLEENVPLGWLPLFLCRLVDIT